MVKKSLIALLVLLISYQIGFAALEIYVGEFAIGETFVDEGIDFGNGSPIQKVSIIYCGTSGNTILLFTAMSPESSNLMAPGYRLVDRTRGTMWYFDFNFGLKGDVTFRIQQSSNNKIKVWRR